ncbi:unnamed protein product, partial [Hapterophycus canaliculatus]
NGGFLSPGTPYFVRVSAMNSVGVGEAQSSETQEGCGSIEGACAPRAPPPPPTAAKVYADPDESLSLWVGWESPEESNGADILSYLVELAPASMGWS